ncbi:MAG: shikimate dehydrogenase [Candidatus Bathyarchaeum tardum]|nr:MAG: shikimate dehydrogenase [Candidatus Bathyarchaeum tardum]
MNVSGKTKVCAIIGDPVEHSLSPVMHNAAFKELGLNLVYVAFTVTAKDLKDALLGVKSLGLNGLNVTMPHKNEVIKYLDELDVTAKSVGAVNTILNNQGKLRGYNTDGEGAIIALQENGVCPEKMKLVLLGAGGAAKAIAYQAAQNVNELVVLNRNSDKAKNLVKLLPKNFGASVKSGPLSFKVLKQELETADILINATCVGMHPDNEISPVPSKLLRPDLNVMDIIYNPLETKLLKDAKTVGAKVISGLEMLIYQGSVAFHIWTNCPAPVEVMRKAALNALKNGGSD